MSCDEKNLVGAVVLWRRSLTTSGQNFFAAHGLHNTEPPMWTQFIRIRRCVLTPEQKLNSKRTRWIMKGCPKFGIWSQLMTFGINGGNFPLEAGLVLGIAEVDPECYLGAWGPSDRNFLDFLNLYYFVKFPEEIALVRAENLEVLSLDNRDDQDSTCCEEREEKKNEEERPA